MGATEGMAATAAMEETTDDRTAYLPGGARTIEWQAIGISGPSKM
jgi:hypothetical protein